jgi:hypothetical protein
VLAGVSMRQVADVSPIAGRDGACWQLVVVDVFSFLY